MSKPVQRVKREDITAEGFYECVLARAGRGGRRVLDTNILIVLRVERDPWYRNSVRYRVIALEAQMQGLKRRILEPRDVLRPATPDEVAKWARYHDTARQTGWVDETLDENAPDCNPPPRTDTNQED